MDTGKPLNFRLCDTRGLEENQGIDSNDISYLLDGNIPDKYQVQMFKHSAHSVYSSVYSQLYTVRYENINNKTEVHVRAS